VHTVLICNKHYIESLRRHLKFYPLPNNYHITFLLQHFCLFFNFYYICIYLFLLHFFITFLFTHCNWIVFHQISAKSIEFNTYITINVRIVIDMYFIGPLSAVSSVCPYIDLLYQFIACTIERRCLLEATFCVLTITQIKVRWSAEIQHCVIIIIASDCVLVRFYTNWSAYRSTLQ